MTKAENIFFMYQASIYGSESKKIPSLNKNKLIQILSRTLRIFRTLLRISLRARCGIYSTFTPLEISKNFSCQNITYIISNGV
jgi:hypothetical protein